MTPLKSTLVVACAAWVFSSLRAAEPTEAELYAADHLAANAFRATQPADVPNKLMQRLRLSSLSSAGIRQYEEGGISVKWTPYRTNLPCPPKDHDSVVTLFGKAYTHPACYYFPHLFLIHGGARRFLYLDLEENVEGRLVVVDPAVGVVAELKVPLDDARCADGKSKARREAFKSLVYFMEFSEKPLIESAPAAAGSASPKSLRLSLRTLDTRRTSDGGGYRRATLSVDFETGSLSYE